MFNYSLTLSHILDTLFYNDTKSIGLIILLPTMMSKLFDLFKIPDTPLISVR